MQQASSDPLIWGQSGRLPDPPALQANAILRLLLCPVALLSIWVPLSQLWRNGEFSACVFVVNNWLMVLMVFINAALWHNQDFAHWWHGVGWCDLLSYVHYAMMTLFTSSACAIMRRLSKKVGLTRVSGLSARERRNNLLVQSLIMFPVPLLQVVVTVFIAGQRYRIMPVSGCDTGYYPNALYVVFFLIPPPMFTIGTCFHTIQTYLRFREIDASSRETLSSAANTTASLRRQRARRKLYFMILCIMVPYTPLIAAFLVFDLMQGWPFQFPVDFHFVHYAGIVPWNSVRLLSYAEAGFVSVNLDWIPVVASFISFIFFGTSKEAINLYRRTLVAVGLGRVFPRLRAVYDPDRSRAGRAAAGSQLNSTVSSNTGTVLSTACTEASSSSSASAGPWSRKGSLAPILSPQQLQQRPLSSSFAAIQAPPSSAWRSGLRRLVTVPRPYAHFLAPRRQRQQQQRQQRQHADEGVELEGGQRQRQRQAPPVSFQDPFQDPFQEEEEEAFPPAFPQPYPAPHLPSTTTTTTTRPDIFNPGLNWATPPTIQDAVPPFAVRRPSAAAANAASSSSSSLPPGRLRRLFPLAPPPPPPLSGEEDTPIYDGTTVPTGVAASCRPAGTAARPVFQTRVWSEAGGAKQKQPSPTAAPPPSPEGGGGHRKPVAGLAGPPTAAMGVAVAAAAAAAAHSTEARTDHGTRRTAVPGGVRVDRSIVTSSRAEAE